MVVHAPHEHVPPKFGLEVTKRRVKVRDAVAPALSTRFILRAPSDLNASLVCLCEASGPVYFGVVTTSGVYELPTGEVVKELEGDALRLAMCSVKSGTVVRLKSCKQIAKVNEL